MLVFIPSSITPVKFEPGGTDPAEMSFRAVTYIEKNLLKIAMFANREGLSGLSAKDGSGYFYVLPNFVYEK